MASCDKCGAFVDEKGKWAPAKHLSEVCTERDKAVREAGELRWTVGSLGADLSAKKALIRKLAELLTEGKVEEALAELRKDA